MRENTNSSDSDNEEKTRLSMVNRIESHIQSKTLSGLLDLVPAIVTLLVILFFVERTDSVIRPLPFVSEQPWDFKGIGLIVSILIFYLFGLLISTRAGTKLSGWKNSLIGHIPVVKNIFGATHQIMTSFTSQYTFSRVVFLEWPREGMIAMGFVTGRAYSTRTNDSMVIVYIPTIPNPTSGNLALVIEDDVIETDIEVDDAMKLVFSGGIILPDAISFARVPREKSEQLELIGRFQSNPNYSASDKNPSE